MKKLQEILRLMRVEKKLSQENLATDLGISITGYAKIERGETDINYSRLEQIASYYGLNVVQLLSVGSGIKTNATEEFKDKEIAHLKEIIKLLEQKLELINEIKAIKTRKKINPSKR